MDHTSYNSSQGKQREEGQTRQRREQKKQSEEELSQVHEDESVQKSDTGYREDAHRRRRKEGANMVEESWV